MRILPDGTVEIRNKNTGETKVISPQDLPNYGISYDTYVTQAKSYEQIPNTQPVLKQEPNAADMKQQEANKGVAGLVDQLKFLYNQPNAAGAKPNPNNNKDLSAGYAGPFGNIGGLVLDIKSAWNMAPDAKTYKRMKEGFTASLKQVTGDTGVLTDQDYKRIADALPNFGDSNETARKAWESVDAILSEKGIDTKFDYNNVSGTPQDTSPLQSILNQANNIAQSPGGKVLNQFGQNVKSDTENMANSFLNTVLNNPYSATGLGKNVAEGNLQPYTPRAMQNNVMGILQPYIDLVKNPGKQVYEKPMTTFMSLLPLANKVLSADTSNMTTKPEQVKTIAEPKTIKPQQNKFVEGVRTKAAEDLLQNTPGATENAIDVGIDPRKVITSNNLRGSYDDLLGPVDQRGYGGQVNARIANAEADIQSTLNNSGGSISWKPVIEELTAKRDSLAKLPTNADKVAALDEAINNLKNQPDIPEAQALDILRSANEQYGKSIVNDAKGAMATQVNKTIANTLRTQLKTKHTEIANALKTQQEMIIIREMLSRARAKSMGGGLASFTKFDITRPLQSIFAPLLRNPNVASRIASGGGGGSL